MAPNRHEALLQQLYHHVVLPRDVPQREDSNLYQIETDLVRRLTDAVKLLAQYAPLGDLPLIDTIRLALDTSGSINVDGKIEQSMLVKELRQLDGHQALILYVTEQNAGLLIYQHVSGDGTKAVVFEAFEASATCEQVMAAEDALEWDFPGQAVWVPYDTFSTDDFQQSLSSFLQQASIESIKQFAAVTYKACALLPEIRDTPNPTLISAVLMTVLEVNGSSHHTPLLRKRVRDTVSFYKARKPWRRSAFYLVLRVAIQRHLYKLFGVDKGRIYFKIIMCIFMSTLLVDGLHTIPYEATHALRQKLGRRLAKLELDRERGAKDAQYVHHYVFRSLRPMLNRAMYFRFNTTHSEIRSPEELLGRYESATALKPFVAIMNRYLPLCAYEEAVATTLQPPHDLGDPARCIHFARKIEAYVSTVQDAFLDYPEFKSRQLLNVMEMWMAMDKHALKCYPLLARFHPGFDASMLDVLQLSSLSECRRLRDIQLYISKRCSGWCGSGAKTIFDTPAEDSFATQYYDESHDALALVELRQHINGEAEANVAEKETEWQQKSDSHAAKIKAIAGLSCVYRTELDEHGIARDVHVKPCMKHTLKWEAKQLAIKVFEYPVPENEAALKAVIFELMCPKPFAAYRDATWLILSTFAIPKKDALEGVPVLRAYTGLSKYANNTTAKVTLGSSTKSHLDSHYSESGFPVPFRHVCRAFGLRLDYYDIAGSTWTKMDTELSFAHLFPMQLPLASAYQAFEHLGDTWPTSNRVLVSQTKCPPDLNVHEYMAWQGLLTGTYTRWPSLLRELGSTNLSFSTDSTWAIVSRLVLQAGPAATDDPLGDAHSIFHDKMFCQKLIEQINVRLEAIQRNWREPVQLDMLVSMLLKILAFASDVKIRHGAQASILKSRTITQGWCASLRSIEQDQESGPSIFIIWAGVLWKRTFYQDLKDDASIATRVLVDFTTASITLQNSLVGKFDTLPYSLRNAVLRDLTLAHSVRGRLEEAMQRQERIIIEALNAFWPLPAEYMNFPITTDIDSNVWWLALTLSTTYTGQYHIHYNYVNGTLLINGQQLNVLPSEYRRWPIVETLFGSQALSILPSALPGMSVVINRQMPNDHWVHFGFRDNKPVIRAEHHGSVLELISCLAFGDRNHYDLPAALVIDCYHWLDLNTGIMEIRQQDPWRSKRSNWRLNLATRQATRNNGSVLVNPNSDVATRVAQNFHLFEFPYNITVYQPPRSNLRVELKRLDLDFKVTQKGLLLCPQLGAVVAETRLQDVGTWYGLQSKLVVRSMKDPSQRSILVPMGETIHELEDSHTTTVIRNGGSYLKFGVNTVLGRIECAAEPVLMYQRALWHASTAHFLPDPLTKRTGVEEALEYLRSGAYSPWTPLSPSACSLLLRIAHFSPRRVYYPTTLQAMELVQWNPDLTITMQDDRYRRVIESILQKSMVLAQFSQKIDAEALPLHLPGNTHLENRALCHRNAIRHRLDHTYKSRDARQDAEEQNNLADLATLIRNWPSQIKNTKHLSSLLETMPVIGGYSRVFDKIQVTDILNADLGHDWGALVRTVMICTQTEKFRLTLLFALLVFSHGDALDVLRAIISFSILPELRHSQLPEPAAYSNFRLFERPSNDSLTAVIAGAKRPCPVEVGISDDLRFIRQLDREKAAARAAKELATSICTQWPSPTPDLESITMLNDNLFDREAASRLVRTEWSRLVDNLLFSHHIDNVQRILLRHDADENLPTDHLFPVDRTTPRLYPLRTRGDDSPNLQEILQKDILPANIQPVKSMNRVLAELPNRYGSTIVTNGRAKAGPENMCKPLVVPAHIKELHRLVAPYKLSESMIHRRYGAELELSIRAFIDHLAAPEALHAPFNPTKLNNDLFDAKEAVRTRLESLRSALLKGDARARWLNAVGLWPKMTALSLLKELRSSSETNFGSGVKQELVDLGLAIAAHQRLLRLQDAIVKDRRQQMYDECDNIGHTNWSPMEYVDWLLLEIDANILIRPEQVDVALATISPTSRHNSVLQLLMGKGKTSCILPMVALVLSNKNLFRIVVPRPLLLQSAQVLQAKLGGLLDREVMHVPFSRKTPTDKTLMQTYCQLHTRIQKQKGIILALPEHILSFKLSGLQRLSDGKVEEASMMIKAQAWLDRHARDVLDECDVSLSIRTQLIYPSGSQQTVDGHPHRWQTIEALLDLVRSYLEDLMQRYPSSIEVVRRAGYPLIYFLRIDVETYLIGQLVQKICRGQTAILPVGEFPASSQEDIRDFISAPVVDAQVLARILNMFTRNRHLVDVVYHLRGLFVHRILLSTLKKRWNVQYGLHPTRDPIAVPYQAKSVPSPTSEWGHPDVAIILTCLSFYYEGLNMRQFKQAIEHLAKSDEPSIEYSLWVADGVPEAFRNYNAVNVEDSQQLRGLHHHIKYKVCLLDFYLNSFVFPVHAKQFSKKLSASGSDLVLYAPTSPACQTTGFSGTNDSRHQLPMTIRQNDLPQLAHTNAEVLAYILEERNRQYVRMVDAYNKRLTEDGLLRKLLYPFGYQTYSDDRIRILIDAGAQILEYDNRSLVKAWLKEDHDAVAAVYFDEEHRARVIYSKGTDLPLVASPFAENLDGCLVYIDESHCRGTDLKLPPTARAAVTLGPHLTKDALAQAAMRLRLLGKTQSVIFFSPPEVHQSILDLRIAAKVRTNVPLSSVDVIRWLLEQTCNGIEQLEPLYFNQNLSYLQRTQAKLEYPDFLNNEDSRKAYLDIVRSKEQQSLKELYEPKYQQRGPTLKASSFAPCLRTHVSEVLERRKGFQDRGFAIHSSALEEVEQEREMEFEVESVREVQPPIHFKALKVAQLHPDLEEFATTGRLPAGSDAFQSMFFALQKTALGEKHGTITATGTAASLYVSTQFTRTVRLKELNDNFLRPCHWLLWACDNEVGMVVSPEEANALIPILRQAYIEERPCHLIVYSAPITRSMLQFNQLNFYAIPSLPATFKAPTWLKVELGLFAGRLYFEWDEYEEIMSYLGIQVAAKEDDEGSPSSHREAFTTKPLAFLHEWLAIRRKGQDFEHTPMGFITTAKPLSADHPFFSATGRENEPDNGHVTAVQNTLVKEEGDDDDSDDGEDHEKEYLFQQDEEDDGVEVYHDTEEEFDDRENTFFSGGAYVHDDGAESKV
ncbi:hypothetical protein EK21DRAFT_67348 [Setomelanomma holmii]|uniref:ubiquitinyl hydrolase 1 n=1 Tax=Setomelanomma holmii TaxID=210430 RepID=A0A9P4LLV3_9PLEO|nr:hypothetical protein EK21DRAFT_67348 [Setomelanomma holmii]